MATLSQGAKVGSYTVKRLIKENNYTETYQVSKDEDIDFWGARNYFMKLFIISRLPEKLFDKEADQVNEIACTEKLQKAGLTKVFDTGKLSTSEGECRYYITSFLEGEMLSERIYRDGTVELNTALNIYCSILEELQKLHKIGLYHNDITPRNIMFSLQESYIGREVKIIDYGHVSAECWGIVPFENDDLELLYLAGETFAGVYGARSDIFAATAVLYTMLTGEPPWKEGLSTNNELRRERKAVLLKDYRKEHPLDVSKFEHEDYDVQTILKRGLALDMDERFRNVDEILTMLDPFADKPKRSGRGNEIPPIYRPGERREEQNNGGNGSGRQQSRDNATSGEGFEIRRGGGNGFEDIAGMAELKDYLKQRVIFVIQNNEMAEKYKLQAPNGMLLYGPPGCGKTFVAEKFAEETGFNFMLVKSSDLASIYVHGSQEKIAELFKKAEQNAPIVICFDEFDALVPDRSNPAAQHTAGEVNEFLSQLNNCNKRGIFVVATTNRPDKIDPAVLRTGRIDKQVFVPLPDKVAREEILKIHLKGRPCSEDIDTARLADLTEGYIASDLAFIVNESALVAAFTSSLITQKVLEETVGTTPPSLRPESLRIYDEIRSKMDGLARKNATARPRIGYIK